MTPLSTRVAGATEGSNDLDREIAIALGWTPPSVGLTCWHDPEGNHWSALDDWTTSIDAAFRLVEKTLPGSKVSLFKQPNGQCGARIRTKEWNTHSSYEHYDEEADPIRYQANGALAIITAMLYALSSSQDSPI